MNDYKIEARSRWGNTDAYKESQTKTVGYSKEKWNDVLAGMNGEIVEFGEGKKCGESADSDTAHWLVKKLQDYITANFYHCTNDILAGLGQMYVCDERFTQNLDKYGEGTAELEIKEQYRNMKEQIVPCMHLIDNAVKAAADCGVVANVEPIRGGTDGARLSYMGLPCPNLGTAGYAFHGPFEHITVVGMQKEGDILTEIVKIYAEY